MQPPIRQPVDPVGLAGQGEVQRGQRDAALLFHQHRLRRPVDGLEQARKASAAWASRARQSARASGPGDAVRPAPSSATRNKRIRASPGSRLALCDEPFQDLVQHRAAQARIGVGAQRVERAQAQDVPGVDRIGVADQRLDLGDRQLLRARRDRRARRGARARCAPDRALAGRRRPPGPASARPASASRPAPLARCWSGRPSIRFTSRFSQREGTVSASAPRRERVSTTRARRRPAGSHAPTGRSGVRAAKAPPPCASPGSARGRAAVGRARCHRSARPGSPDRALHPRLQRAQIMMPGCRLRFRAPRPAQGPPRTGRRSPPGSAARLSGFAGQAVCRGLRRLPRFPKPKLAGAGAACPGPALRSGAGDGRRGLAATGFRRAVPRKRGGDPVAQSLAAASRSCPAQSRRAAPSGKAGPLRRR